MAVVVTDIQMPSECALCPFSFRVDNGHTCCARHPEKSPNEDGTGRPEHCPLVDYEPVMKKLDAMEMKYKMWTACFVIAIALINMIVRVT